MQPNQGTFLWRAVLLLGLLPVACDSLPERNETVHPTRENLPEDPVYIGTDSLPAALSPESLVRWTAARDRLLSYQMSVRIGEEGMGREEGGPELFGRIGAATTDSLGRLFVLDENAQEIRVFSGDGSHVATFGGIGDGPDEMRGATDMFVSADGNVVWALGFGWYKRFEWQEDGSYGGSGVELVRAPSGGQSCSLGEDRLILSGMSSSEGEHLLHEISPADWTLQRSFGSAYQTPSQLVRYMMSINAPVACDPARGVIAQAFEAMPHVRIFGAGGELLRVSQNQDYKQLVMLEYVDEQGRHSFGARGAQEGEDAYDTVRSLHLYGGDYLVWQFLRTPAGRARGDDEMIRTFLLDIETGEGSLVSDGGIPRLASVGRNHFVAIRQNPYPQVEVWTAGE